MNEISEVFSMKIYHYRSIVNQTFFNVGSFEIPKRVNLFQLFTEHNFKTNLILFNFFDKKLMLL